MVRGEAGRLAAILTWAGHLLWFFPLCLFAPLPSFGDMLLMFYPENHILPTPPARLPNPHHGNIPDHTLHPHTPCCLGVRMSENITQSVHFYCHLTSLSCCIMYFGFLFCNKRYLKFLKGVSWHSLLGFLLLIRIHHSPPRCTWSVLDITVAKMRWCQALSALRAEPRGVSPQVDQLPSLHKLAFTLPTCRPTCFVLPAQQQSLLVPVCPLSYFFFSNYHVQSAHIFTL